VRTSTELTESTLIALLDAGPDAMLVIDEAGLIVLVNAQARKLFDYRSEDLIGRRVELLVPIADSRYRPNVTGMPMVGRRSDGSEFLTEISMSTIATDAGLLVSAVVRDATARIEGEAELVRVNRKAEGRRLEAEADRITAEGEKEVAERVRLVAEVDRITAEGEKEVAERVRLVAEVDRITAEGEKEVAEQVRLEAEVDRELLEAQLHQSQRMESLGQLAGGVAHDFNNLLGVILNYAAFVGEELTRAAATPTGSQWEEPLKDVKQIQLAAGRGALLTRQLLSFARREVVQARALDLNIAIRRMEHILRRTIGEQIELVINLAPDLPMIVADPGQIEQIVLNLAINARDAMPTGGRLSIDTAMRDITENENTVRLIPLGSYVSFRVSDTGVGMSEEVREHAFEPFFTTKSSGEGSGLGLATVYGIVSQSGGYTKLLSEEGVGTSIAILLPAAEDETARDEITGRVDDLDSLGGTETILVTDDEDEQREVAKRILTRNGYTVLTASSGAHAVEFAASHAGPIDLLLTDVIMPQMQGPAVAREVRGLRPDIRVLFMSGHAHPVLEAEALLGMEFLLMEKPFDETTILQNIRKVLDSDV
jgi:PAS domain S-box-containing protein